MSGVCIIKIQIFHITEEIYCTDVGRARERRRGHPDTVKGRETETERVCNDRLVLYIWCAAKAHLALTWRQQVMMSSC